MGSRGRGRALTSTPPNLVGTAAGWGEYDGAMYLLYGTEGSGAWRRTMTW
jgi:hypothetical protein